MKIIVLYYSSHHGNTKKLVDAAAAAGAAVCDVTKDEETDLTAYDLIGLASGIYGGNFGKPLLNYVKERLPEGRPVFLLYTYAMKMGHYTNGIRKAAEEKKCFVIGEYGCQGFNTFGPFRLMGGTGKGHPTDEEIQGAGRFVKDLAAAGIPAGPEAGDGSSPEEDSLDKLTARCLELLAEKEYPCRVDFEIPDTENTAVLSVEHSGDSFLFSAGVMRSGADRLKSYFLREGDEEKVRQWLRDAGKSAGERRTLCRQLTELGTCVNEDYE